MTKNSIKKSLAFLLAMLVVFSIPMDFLGLAAVSNTNYYFSNDSIIDLPHPKSLHSDTSAHPSPDYYYYYYYPILEFSPAPHDENEWYYKVGLRPRPYQPEDTHEFTAINPPDFPYELLQNNYLEDARFEIELPPRMTRFDLLPPELSQMSTQRTEVDSAIIIFNNNGHFDLVLPDEIVTDVPNEIILCSFEHMVYLDGYTFQGWLHPETVHVLFPGDTIIINHAGVIELFALFTPITPNNLMHFGIEPMAASQLHPAIIHPIPYSSVPFEALQVMWTSVPGARTYLLSLRDLPTYTLRLYHADAGNATSLILPRNLLTPGHWHRVAVASVIADTDGDTARWTTGYFLVRQQQQQLPRVQYVNIFGLPHVGLPLTAQPIFDSHVANPQLRFQWYMWNGIDWSAIPGATSATFTPTVADAGMFVRVVVGGIGTNVCDHRVVSPLVRVEPILSSIQSVDIYGIPRVGNTLSAHVIYNPPLANPQVRFQWRIWNTSIFEWVDIPGATSATLELTTAFANTNILLRVTGTGANVTEISRSSLVVFVESHRSTIRSVSISGDPIAGSTLRANVILNRYVANPIIEFQWQRYAGSAGWTDIPGANASTFSLTSAHGSQFIRVYAVGTGVNVDPIAISSPWVQIAGNPVNIQSVSIVGSPSVDGVLGISITYSGPVTNPDINIQWQRWRWMGAAGGTWNILGEWTDIPSANEAELALTAADAHVFIRVRVAGRGGRVTTTQKYSDDVRIMPRLDGPQVIECFSRSGRIDALSNVIIPVHCIRASESRNPIWEFVHINDRIYAIRNASTGRYLTNADGSLRHEPRIGTAGVNYNTSQSWRVLLQADGSFRIQSVSDGELFITERAGAHVYHVYGAVGAVTLAALNPNLTYQQWHIGYIWHLCNTCNQCGVNVGFWRGPVVNIYMYNATLGRHSGTDFHARMAEAKSAWGDALNISFNIVSNRADANIIAFGGSSSDVDRSIGSNRSLQGRAGVMYTGATERVGGIHAGGALRGVVEHTGRGFSTRDFTGANIMAVVSSGSESRQRMVAMHELGHALGYMGHSPNPNDVMRAGMPLFGSNTILSPAEIEHLRQIYRARYRW